MTVQKRNLIADFSSSAVGTEGELYSDDAAAPGTAKLPVTAVYTDCPAGSPADLPCRLTSWYAVWSGANGKIVAVGKDSAGQTRVSTIVKQRTGFKVSEDDAHLVC